MKRVGDICWFKEERDHNIRQVYKGLRAEYGFSVPKKELYEMVAKHAARRFWVVPSSARRTLRKMMYGVAIPRQPPERKRMYSDLLSRVRDYMHDHHSATFAHAVSFVVQQRAPEFYMSPHSIKRIILNTDRHDL